VGGLQTLQEALEIIARVPITPFVTHLFSTCPISRPLVWKGATIMDREEFIVPMLIHKFGPAEKNNTTPRWGLLDSGSDVSLVPERILKELGIPYYHDSTIKVCSLGKERIEITGRILLSWSVDGKVDKHHNTEFLVVPARYNPNFDFLLGRDWIVPTKALVKNLDVLLLGRFNLNMLKSRMLSTRL